MGQRLDDGWVTSCPPLPGVTSDLAVPGGFRGVLVASGGGVHSLPRPVRAAPHGGLSGPDLRSVDAPGGKAEPRHPPGTRRAPSSGDNSTLLFLNRPSLSLNTAAVTWTLNPRCPAETRTWGPAPRGSISWAVWSRQTPQGRGADCREPVAGGRGTIDSFRGARFSLRR